MINATDLFTHIGYNDGSIIYDMTITMADVIADETKNYDALNYYSMYVVRIHTNDDGSEMAIEKPNAVTMFYILSSNAGEIDFNSDYKIVE